MNNKKIVKLNESQLRELVRESFEKAINEGYMMDKIKIMYNIIKTHPQESFAALVAAGLLTANMTINPKTTYDNDNPKNHGEAVYDDGKYVDNMPSYDEIQKGLNNY